MTKLGMMFTSSKLFAYIALSRPASEKTTDVSDIKTKSKRGLWICMSTIKLAAMNTNNHTITHLASHEIQYHKMIFVFVIGEMRSSSRLLNILAVKKPNDVKA